MVRRSPSPDCPPSGRAVGVRHPHAVGARVWVWGLNTTTPTRTLYWVVLKIKSWVRMTLL